MKTPWNHRKHLTAYVPAPAGAGAEELIAYAPRRSLPGFWQLIVADNPFWSAALLLTILVLFAIAFVGLPLSLLLAILSLSGGFALPLLLSFVMLSAVAIAALFGGVAIINMYFAQQPTAIAAGAGGLRFLYLHQGESQASALIPWEAIISAHLRSAGFFAGGAPEIEILVDRDRLPPAGKEAYFFLHRRKAAGSEQSAVRIALSCIKEGTTADNLHAKLSRHLLAEKYSLELQNILHPLTLESYTSLWLRDFESKLVRLREGPLPPGSLIGNGRYRIVRELGGGGQALAYLCLDLACVERETVVLKEFIIPCEASTTAGKRAIGAISEEAYLLSKINHPQIVGFHDLFIDDHRAYLVLEHVAGDCLSDFVAAHAPLPERTVINWGEQICRILIFLHNQEPPVIHQDLTPENLIQTPAGLIKLIDFSVSLSLTSVAGQTAAGKQAYMAPEQLRGHPGKASDIYALGACLFFFLTGKRPEPLAVQHPQQWRNGVSEALAAIVARSTAQTENERYCQAEELLSALGRLRQSESSVA